MSNKPLDELYFVWLCGQVGCSIDQKNPSKSYWRLLKQLYTKEFVWIVANDDNRAEDGRFLREEFLRGFRVKKIDEDWVRLGCSMLELIIALSRRLAFEAEGEPRDWFWLLLKNLGIAHYNDSSRYSFRRVDEILEKVIWRQYDRNGSGGLFPLNHNINGDQRRVEMWYQLSAYVLERI